MTKNIEIGYNYYIFNKKVNMKQKTLLIFSILFFVFWCEQNQNINKEMKEIKIQPSIDCTWLPWCKEWEKIEIQEIQPSIDCAWLPWCKEWEQIEIQKTQPSIDCAWLPWCK